MKPLTPHLSYPIDKSDIGSKRRKNTASSDLKKRIGGYGSCPCAICRVESKERQLRQDSRPDPTPKKRLVRGYGKCNCPDCEEDPLKLQSKYLPCRAEELMTLEAWCDNCHFCDAQQCFKHDVDCSMLIIGSYLDCDCGACANDFYCAMCMCTTCNLHKTSKDAKCCE